MWLAYPCIFCILLSGFPLSASFVSVRCHRKQVGKDRLPWATTPPPMAGGLPAPLDRCTKRSPNIVTHVSFSLRFSLLLIHIYIYISFFGCWQTNFKANAILSQVTETTPQPVVGFPPVVQVVQVAQAGSGACMSPCQRYPYSDESLVTSSVGKSRG